MNALIGEKGLECRVHLPPLVVDQQLQRSSTNLVQLKAPPGGISEASCSSDESESELEMDRRLRRGRGVRGKRRSRQTQKPPGLPTAAHGSAKVHSAARGEEEVKVQSAALLCISDVTTCSLLQSKPHPVGGARDESGSESEDDDKEQGKQPADTALIEVCVVRTRIGVIMFYHLSLSSPTSSSSLSQLASFPGYDPDHPTPLPHGLVPLDQMKRVTRAQTKLASKVQQLLTV